MRDCIILGSGRSGTSMVAGTLASAGYHMGEGLHLPRASNPKGFFEAPEINGINEELLAGVLEPTPVLTEGQRWLGIPQDSAAVDATPPLTERMRTATAESPICFKDPRFCFTLDAWQSVLGEAARVCVFRHPARTAQSIVEECGRADYLRGVTIDASHALRLWTAMYRSVLEAAEGGGDWLFLHYDQALQPDGLRRLGTFLEVSVDTEFPDPRLRRALPEIEVPAEALELYERLCNLARYEPEYEAPLPESAVPEISVLAWIGPGEAGYLDEIASDARAQRGIQAELVIIDATSEGGLECPGALVVRHEHPSRGLGWKRALEVARAPLVALQLAGCRTLPAHLAHAVDALEKAPGAELALCDYYLHDTAGQFVDRAHPAGMGGEPGPFWLSGAVLRREVLGQLADTAFHPTELALYASLRTRDAVTHVLEPGFSVAKDSYAAGWERSRQDAALVGLAARSGGPDRPELTVSICTYQRRDVLLECLEAFSRQLVRPGTFELVVVDDGCTDGTTEWLRSLELPVPTCLVHRENGGLAAARNSGLAVSRGRLVLFVNDDTIPDHDLVEQHIETHARLPRAEFAVLGSLHQPAAALDNALMAHLETSTEIFDFAALQPGAVLDGFHFYTCNVSVPLDAVRRQGGFDPSFRHYGCEDTDLGLRLEGDGYRVLYAPNARAEHHHVLTFDDLRRRQRTVASAYVRLARKHPEILAKWNNEALTVEGLRAMLEPERSNLEVTEAAVRELSKVDVGALERLDGPYRRLAAEVRSELAARIGRINQHWWWGGYLAGLQEHGLTGFPELCSAGTHPRPITTQARVRLLAHPRWERASLTRLFELAEPLGGSDRAALVLRRDPATDPPHDEAITLLQAAYDACFQDGAELEVVIEDAPLTRSEWLQFGHSVDALLVLGTEQRELLEGTAAERVTSRDEVQRLLDRFEPSARTEPAAEEVAPILPELTVVVPTHDRPRELAQLLERLDRQTLDRRTFEVIVVDDGSTPPAATSLANRTRGYELTWLRQEEGGPGRARNAALAGARGEVIVFFNDDAVPATDCLRRHRDAHRQASPRSGARAVLGTFTQLPRLVRDSFTRLVETSKILFAQPAMKAGVHYRGHALCTGNVSIRRDVLLEVDGFDEALGYAGGEDSELGLRLDRRLDLRVVYDPRIGCGHDHVLDIHGYAERQRILGWAALHVENAHGSTGLVAPAGVPMDAAFWNEVRAEAQDTGEERERLGRTVADLCRGEREAGRGPTAVQEIRPMVERLGRLEFARGLWLAREGRLPAEVRELGRVPSSTSHATDPGNPPTAVACGAPPRVPPCRVDERYGDTAAMAEPS